MKSKASKAERAKDFIKISNMMSVGIQLVLCTFIGIGIGWFLDKKFHTAPVWLIIFMLLGIGAGFINVFRTLDKD